jgi:EB1-like C-terminal motif
MQAFYDQSGATPRDGYDAKAARAKGKGGKKYNDTMAKGGNAKSTASGRPSSRVSPSTTQKPRVAARPVRPTAATKTNSPSKKAPLKPNSENNKTTSNEAADLSSAAQADAQLLKKNAELEKRVRELEASIADIEKERDFYFGKLRNVELMLQVKQDKNFEECQVEGVVDNIFKVLYATADEDVAVDEDGEVGRVAIVRELRKMVPMDMVNLIGWSDLLMFQIIPLAEAAAADTSAFSAELSDALASEIMAGEPEDDFGQ